MGVIISVSSNNWLSIWVGLELSLISFIPMVGSTNKLSSESCIKYFIIQSVSSSIMMMGVIMISLNITFDLIIALSMIMKLGMVPFHTWVISIINGLNYIEMILMFTIMKIAPLLILTYMNLDMSMISMLGMLVSSSSGLNQNCMKKILSFSSMYNMSVCISSINELSIWLSFMIIYSTSVAIFIYMMKKLSVNYLNQIIIYNNSMINKLMMWSMMITMGGMPPMPMFIGKIMILENLILNMNLLTSLTLIFTSLFTMFFYMRMSLISLMMFSTSTKWMIKLESEVKLNIILLIISITPFLLSLKSLN